MYRYCYSLKICVHYANFVIACIFVLIIFAGDAHRVVQIDPLQVHRQQKLSEKQEWFRIQKERLQSSKVKANVTNPVDRMFGEKDPQTLPVAVTLKQEEPPVCEEDVSPVANVVSVSSVKDVSETQHEETKSSTGVVYVHKYTTHFIALVCLCTVIASAFVISSIS